MYVLLYFIYERLLEHYVIQETLTTASPNPRPRVLVYYSGGIVRIFSIYCQKWNSLKIQFLV